MTDIKQQAIETFLNNLASKQATPGGGSVAALMGAQSAALTSMVCNLTVGKEKYAAVQLDMENLLVQAQQLQNDLTAMIQADVDVFNQLMACYGLPKETDIQKVQRSDAIQMVLKEATNVPLACAKACLDAIKLSAIAADKGSLAVISDAGAAVMAAYSGFKTAALNVHINANSLKDTQFAEQKLQELAVMTQVVESETQRIYQQVLSKL